MSFTAYKVNDVDYIFVQDPSNAILSVADVTARNAIAAGDRVAGMLVVTQDTNTVWQLRSDLTTWDLLVSRDKIWASANSSTRRLLDTCVK